MRITPHQLNMTASETLDIYRAMEVEIFKIVANRIKNNGSSSLLDWQLEKMSQLHLLNNEVLQVLSEYSGVATDEIREVITEAGYKCIDDVDNYMPDKLPKPYSNSVDMMMEGYVKQAFRDINNYVNQTLISTNYGTGSVMSEYQQTMNKIAALHMSGIYTLDEAIYKTVVDWSKKGISSTFIDKGGHTWSMERYVDMVMRSTLQRTYNEVRTSRMAEYDVHTVLVSSHPKSRPACALCQGTVVDLRPPGKNTSGYRSVYEFGYGEPAGHRGINCTHLHFPFIPGVNENNQPQYDPDEAVANENVEQGRKKIAREIRQTKKDIVIANTLDAKQLPKLQQKLRQQQSNMREYVAKHNLKRDYQLEKVYTTKEQLLRSRGEFDYTQKQKVDFKNNQDYRRVKLSENITEFNRQNVTIISRASETTVNHIYVSDKIKVKPKQLHYIDSIVSGALKYIKMPEGSNAPKIAIVGASEIRPGAVASYSPLHHTIFITDSIRNRKSMLAFQDELAVGNNHLSTMVHEMIHAQDAANYKLKYGNITSENLRYYFQYLDDKAYKYLEKNGISEYDISKISTYAYDSYDKEQFNETYTEYLVKEYLER